MTFCYYVDYISSAQYVENKKTELKGDITGGEFVCVFVLIVPIDSINNHTYINIILRVKVHINSMSYQCQ